MKPIGMLMREHRLIEKMVDLLQDELVNLEEDPEIDLDFFDVDADFFRIYADQTHHGKEEDILFEELLKKKISPDHRTMIGTLIREHEHARQVINSLVEGKEAYQRGDTGVLQDVKACIGELLVFYPEHIEKEDKSFFYPCMEYFSDEEMDIMLQKFRDYDLAMIHTKYQRDIDKLQKRLKTG